MPEYNGGEAGRTVHGDASPAHAARDAQELRPLHMRCVLALVTGSAGIGIDLSLPAVPAMERAFGAAPGEVEFSITSYLLGIGLGQLVWGPLSDNFGRKRPVLIGLAFFILGAIGCALSSGVDSLIRWRLVQGLGGSACVVLSRAMVSDRFSGERAAQFMSTLSMLTVMAPLLGPMVGAQLLHFGSWQWLFFVLAGWGAIAMLGTASLAESLPVHRRERQSLGGLFRGCGEILRNGQFIKYAGVAATIYGSWAVYLAGTPSTFMGYYGVSPQDYAVLFGVNVVGSFVANAVNARIVTRFGRDFVLQRAILGAAILSAGIGVTSVTGLGGMWSLFVFLFLFMLTTGFILANSISSAIESCAGRAGMGSALLGAMQYGVGIVSSGVFTVMIDGTPRPMGVIILVSVVSAFVFARFGDAIAARLDRSPSGA